MDFDKYRIRMNIKACCMYEQMAGKSFFLCNTVDDALLLMYCSLVVNNDMILNYSTFRIMLETNKKIEEWIMKEYERISKYIQQFNSEKEESDSGETGEEMKITVSDMATALIVQHKVDAHYVMYEMEMWEIMPLYKTADNSKKAELEEKRMWTYLTIAPHIDGKKVKSPEELLPFPWEKETKKERALKDIEKNKELINRIFNAVPDQEKKEE